MATLGWIDFSPTHREKVGAALELLSPDNMVDELGLGSLRDGMANQMFPGLSTIQTRAKYFFIVPYILHEYQQLASMGKVKNKSASKYLELREYEIMWQLGEMYRGQKNSGVIGGTRLKPQRIIRRPSATYWNGLNTYDLIKTGGLSAEIFLKQAMKGEYESLLAQISESDQPVDDADAEYENIFRLRVSPPKNWDIDLTLDLSSHEAEILYNNITAKAKDKILSYLLHYEEVWNIFNAAGSFVNFAETVLPALPNNPIREEIILAHDFSELMYGAHITYNCLLQSAAYNKDTHEEEWNEWYEGLSENMLDYGHFNLDKLLSYNLNTRKATIVFVRNWLELVKSPRVNINKRNALVLEQEYLVKRGKARLKWKKFDDVREEQWIGFRQLDYRYRTAKTIIKDIKAGLDINVTP
jgi:hypothetical protein